MGYVYVTSQPQLEEAAHTLLTSGRLVGLDLETTGINPHLDVPLLCGIGDYIVPLAPGLVRKMHLDPWGPLGALCESVDLLKVLHNAVFDGMFFQVRKVMLRHLLDTMIAAQLLVLGVPKEDGTFTLGNQLLKVLGVMHNKDDQTSFIGVDPESWEPATHQLEYLHRDVNYLPALAQKLAGYLTQRGLMETWRLENRYTQVLAMMHVNGVRVDVDRYMPEIERVDAEFARLEAELSTVLTPHILEVRRRRFAAYTQRKLDWQAEYDKVQQKHSQEVYGADAPTPGKEELRDRWNALNGAWQAEHRRPPNNAMNNDAILVTSPQQIQAALVQMGVDVDSTNKDKLILASAGRNEDEQKVLLTLGEFSVVKKLKSNEGRDLLGRLVNGDRLTTRYDQMMKTGRLSSSQWGDKGRCPHCLRISPPSGWSEKGTLVWGPCVCGTEKVGMRFGTNMQNLTGAFKKFCRPNDDNHVFVVGDYSQIELRVAAELILREDAGATDALVQAFIHDEDPHSRTASYVVGWKYEDFLAAHLQAEADKAAGKKLTTEQEWIEGQRKAGKTTNFSTVFFISPEKLAVKIYVASGDKTRFGKAHISLAADFIDAFWDVNPTLRPVLDRYGDQALSEGYTETLGGRRLNYLVHGIPHWQKGSIRRRAANHPIQGTAADVCKRAQNVIYEALHEAKVDDGVDPDVYLFAAVHDEIGLHTHRDVGPAWVEALGSFMDQSFHHYLKHVPAGASVHQYDHWEH